MKSIQVRLKDRNYRILIGEGLLSSIGKHLEVPGLGRRVLVVTNSTVNNQHGGQIKDSIKDANLVYKVVEVPDTERSKSFTECQHLLSELVSFDKKEGICLIAFGGGVIGDLAGFVASIYNRGIPLVHVPTTLLAQVDSAIGGKVAVDLKEGKNLIGAFHQPRLVLSDISLIRTLPPREVRSGLAEIVKYGVIKNVRLFKYIENNLKRILAVDFKCLEYIISVCADIKAKVVERDERDNRGIRATLNYGHTIGHAIETATEYSSDAYNHGEAISVGMLCAADIAEGLGMLKKEEKGRIEGLLKAIELPTRIKGCSLDKILEVVSRDKKFQRGVNRFILPCRIGRVKVVEDVSEGLIKDALKKRMADD